MQKIRIDLGYDRGRGGPAIFEIFRVGSGAAVFEDNHPACLCCIGKREHTDGIEAAALELGAEFILWSWRFPEYPEFGAKLESLEDRMRSKMRRNWNHRIPHRFGGFSYFRWGSKELNLKLYEEVAAHRDWLIDS